jgi:hypothetical protein
VRFNYETGEWQELLTDEIEWIDSVSPDGRYTVLYIGGDDRVAIDRLLAEGTMSYIPDPPVHLAVYDLHEHQIVYEATRDNWNSGYNYPIDPYGGQNGVQLTWMDANTFLIQGVDGDSDAVIRLDEGVEIVAEWTGLHEHRPDFMLSPDNHRILLNYGFGHYDVFDFETGETITIVDGTEQNPSIGWHDSDTLWFSISGGSAHLQLASWLIDLPQ